MHGVDLGSADLKGSDLRGAIITNRQLQEIKSLQGATKLDGSKHP
jgi:uncharacterized protein YjbI with pentapeptide repeats